MLLTKDLIIRKSIIEDIDYFYEWELKPEISNFFSIDSNQSYDTVIRTFIHDDDDNFKRQYTIILKETDEPIGRIVLNDINKGWKAEIFRIYIGVLPLRGKGFGKQAMQSIMKLAFEEWNVERLYLDHYTKNPASELYKSLGFKNEGVLRNACRKNGKLHDVQLMSILKNEYFEKHLS